MQACSQCSFRYSRLCFHTRDIDPIRIDYALQPKDDVWRLGRKACEDNDTDLLDEMISMVPNRDLNSFHLELLCTAIQHNSIAILHHLVNNHAVECKLLSSESVATVPLPSITTLDFLLAHGWDINNCKRYGDFGDQRCDPLLWRILADDDLVQWCLERGAHVTIFYSPKRSILKKAASLASFASFRLLHAAGAPLGRRTLHLAVLAASLSHTGSDDPEKDTAKMRQSREDHADRMALVAYSIDTLCLDVNAKDWKPGDPGFSGHIGSGTPICYVLDHCNPDWVKNTRALIWLLLDRGADPTPALKDADSQGMTMFKEYVCEWKNEKECKRAKEGFRWTWSEDKCGVQ